MYDYRESKANLSPAVMFMLAQMGFEESIEPNEYFSKELRCHIRVCEQDTGRSLAQRIFYAGEKNTGKELRKILGAKGYEF